jgi:3-oxoacyl-[acyl-carrier-protein] synthase II
MAGREVVITGIGLVSCFGEGTDAHWARLTEAGPRPTIDAGRYPPYTIHPLPAVDWGLQIPKRGDQRQMETWQRLGTYCAGLALDDAGIKPDEALCASMDMIVAAGGGERDETVDASILEASLTRNDREVMLNERLTTDLRPTLFLAQLSNLLAGNISIVHKVTGSSRTFMGEEGAGVAAIETAAARIRHGQSSHVLVGASFQTEHPDMLLGYELGGFLHRGEWAPVWQRDARDGGGVVSGSGGAFLVLEERGHAEARGARAYASLPAVGSSRALRDAATLPGAIRGLVAGLGGNGAALVVSGASGAHLATAAEKAALGDHVLRGFSSLTGHMKEAQFPFAVALAALAVANGRAFPPFSTDERDAPDAPREAIATAIGYYHFEGAARVAAL